MTATLILFLVGAGDLVRGVRSRALAALVSGVVVVGLSALAVWGLSVPLPLVAAAVVVAVFWILAMPIADRPGDPAPPLWPVAVLVIAVVVAVVVDPSQPAGPVADWIETASRGFDTSAVLATVAVGLVLLRSANLVVRAALGTARSTPEGGIDAAIESATPPSRPESTGRGWVIRVGRRRVASLEAASSGQGLQLRGGRMIGPLERLLIVALFLLGAHPAIVALLAAKGIVRFPEINADRGKGSKAEEFLIGSLSSWALAVAGIVFVAVVG